MSDPIVEEMMAEPEPEVVEESVSEPVPEPEPEVVEEPVSEPVPEPEPVSEPVPEPSQPTASEVAQSVIGILTTDAPAQSTLEARVEELEQKLDTLQQRFEKLVKQTLPPKIRQYI